MDRDFFRIDDTPEYIRRVQRRLREISRSDGSIPEVFIDGIYGEETRNAVSAVQRNGGLPITGELDRETFEMILRLYNAVLDSRRVDGFRPKFDEYEGQVMRLGDDFDDVFVLQLLLRELSIKDDRFFVDMNGRFDPQTENSVKLLQKILGREQDGRVNREVWNELLRLAENTEFYK